MAAYEKRKIPGEKTFQIAPRGYGPFQVIEHINDNAYKLDLPGEYNGSATFKVTDSSPFDVGGDLRANPFQEEGNDGVLYQILPKLIDNNCYVLLASA